MTSVFKMPFFSPNDSTQIKQAYQIGDLEKVVEIHGTFFQARKRCVPADIKEIYSKAKQDLQSIKKMGTKFEFAILNQEYRCYKKTGDKQKLLKIFKANLPLIVELGKKCEALQNQTESGAIIRIVTVMQLDINMHQKIYRDTSQNLLVESLMSESLASGSLVSENSISLLYATSARINLLMAFLVGCTSSRLRVFDNSPDLESPEIKWVLAQVQEQPETIRSFVANGLANISAIDSKQIESIEEKSKKERNQKTAESQEYIDVDEDEKKNNPLGTVAIQEKSSTPLKTTVSDNTSGNKTTTLTANVPSFPELEINVIDDGENKWRATGAAVQKKPEITRKRKKDDFQSIKPTSHNSSKEIGQEPVGTVTTPKVTG